MERQKAAAASMAKESGRSRLDSEADSDLSNQDQNTDGMD